MGLGGALYIEPACFRSLIFMGISGWLDRGALIMDDSASSLILQSCMDSM